MPYQEPFSDGGAFTKMQKMSRCPMAGGAITPNYVGIRRESFVDRNLGMPANVGSTAGSIEDFEVGGQSALTEGGSHIAFATRHRGGKEAMRNPYNTFSHTPPYGSATVGGTNYHRAPDSRNKMGAPGGIYSGKERFIGSYQVGTLYRRPLNNGLPMGINFT